MVPKKFTKGPDQVVRYLRFGLNGRGKEYHSYCAEHVKIELCYLWTDEEHEESDMNPYEP